MAASPTLKYIVERLSSQRLSQKLETPPIQKGVNRDLMQVYRSARQKPSSVHYLLLTHNNSPFLRVSGFFSIFFYPLILEFRQFIRAANFHSLELFLVLPETYRHVIIVILTENLWRRRWRTNWGSYIDGRCQC